MKNRSVETSLILEEMFQKGISDEDIAVLVKKTSSAVYRWRKGKTFPGYSDKSIIEKYYKTHME